VGRRTLYPSIQADGTIHAVTTKPRRVADLRHKGDGTVQDVLDACNRYYLRRGVHPDAVRVTPAMHMSLCKELSVNLARDDSLVLYGVRVTL